jgi:hypothetical protein
MAKKSKRPTLRQQQIERGIEFAKLNEDFPERWYPNGEPNWSDEKIRSKAANGVLAFNVFRGVDHSAGPLHLHSGRLA